jgi:CRP-like cAMP-binding protein
MRPTPEQLSGIDVFQSLSDAQLAAVATLSDLRTVEPGTRLLEEGAAPDGLFILLKGSAVAEARGRSFELAPGEVFGEMALLGMSRGTATVTSTTRASVVVIHGSDFEVFERDFPRAVAVLRQTMAERLARSSD